MTSRGNSGDDNLDADLLVVSHAAVVSTNQLVFAELVKRGWKLRLVLPQNWRHEYADRPFQADIVPELADSVVPCAVALAGRPQRHIYLASAARVINHLRPRVLFCQEDSFSISAGQWGRAAWRRGIPFGVKASENLDRPLPAVARMIRNKVLQRASFVAARSPVAASLVLRWGAQGTVSVLPNHVPEWPRSARTQSDTDTFTIGFAGRLVPQKGLDTLVGAIRRLSFPTVLEIVGNGPMRSWLEQQSLGSGKLRILTDISHSNMPQAYAEMDLLVLPSRTTPTWSEQFGRVLVEALWCGVPVVGSSSGEIPWVIETTGGGRVFPEGDEAALAQVISELRASPELRYRLAASGRAEVERQFSVSAVADKFEQILRPWASASHAESR